MTIPARDNLLLIAAREPVAGETKTRLGATIGMERAARLYRAFLADLAMRFVDGDGYQFGWAVTSDCERFRAAIGELCPARANGEACYVQQCGEDWGIRQTNLLRWGAEHGYMRTVLTASDSPQMACAEIIHAFDLLADHDVVIGRVHDGGYYLIGVCGFHDVLTGVPMSTASAADALVARAGAQGLRVGEVCGTFDVDIEADLDLLIDLVRDRPEIAPATSRALHELDLVGARNGKG